MRFIMANQPKSSEITVLIETTILKVSLGNASYSHPHFKNINLSGELGIIKAEMGVS